MFSNSYSTSELLINNSLVYQELIFHQFKKNNSKIIIGGK